MTPPGFGAGWAKLRGAQGYRDPIGYIWRLVKEIRFDGTQLWPGGAKNRNKKP